jgi:hypothetical protein
MLIYFRRDFLLSVEIMNINSILLKNIRIVGYEAGFWRDAVWISCVEVNESCY